MNRDRARNRFIENRRRQKTMPDKSRALQEKRQLKKSGFDSIGIAQLRESKNAYCAMNVLLSTKPDSAWVLQCISNQKVMEYRLWKTRKTTSVSSSAFGACPCYTIRKRFLPFSKCRSMWRSVILSRMKGMNDTEDTTSNNGNRIAAIYPLSVHALSGRSQLGSVVEIRTKGFI